jgi:hypothetical protein
VTQPSNAGDLSQPEAGSTQRGLPPNEEEVLAVRSRDGNLGPGSIQTAPGEEPHFTISLSWPSSGVSTRERRSFATRCS